MNTTIAQRLGNLEQLGCTIRGDRNATNEPYAINTAAVAEADAEKVQAEIDAICKENDYQQTEFTQAVLIFPTWL